VDSARNWGGVIQTAEEKENSMKTFGKAACLAALVMMTALPGMAQSVAEGNWINLFDGETLYGWNDFGDVEWTVADGAIQGVNGYSGFLATTSRFSDFELVLKAKVENEGTLGVVVRGALEGHQAENGGSGLVLEQSNKVQEITIKAIGNTVVATVDGKSVKMPAPARKKGHILIQNQHYHSGDTPVITITEARLRPLNLGAIFNGKNLDGWNIIPERQSVFSVVDGAINIKDGNGQIETAGVYEDFVLQLDIISNGEHLNSGVFFRGPVGVFWKGYESQVRNHWKKERTDPVDFGTGGIYGVRPARKVVSTDGKWFQKTLICDDNHIAVWIDGYQVSDFYDTRPVHKRGDGKETGDGKNGYVSRAGTIHLQGHDKTTDLSFKNINVGVYSKN
jgi:hypothetical protein